MAVHKLENYLKTHRRKAGLWQDEVAFLIDHENGGQVSRFEKRNRLPPLQTALALEAVYGVPVSQLFAGMYAGIEKQVQKRRLELRSKLQAEARKGSEAQVRDHKVRWLTDRIGPETGADNST